MDWEMWLLARFRIMPKIIVVISLPAATAVAIGRLGVHAMASLNAGADNMSFAARRALAAARANQSAIALNRSEFRIASDPSPENQLTVRSQIEEQMKVARRLNFSSVSQDVVERRVRWMTCYANF
jgi:methyl-accepting chemotaxis protein